MSHGNPCDLISDCIIRVSCHWFHVHIIHPVLRSQLSDRETKLHSNRHVQLFVIIHSTLRSELLGGEKPGYYITGNSLDEKLSIVGYGLINIEISHGNPCDLIPDCIIRVPCHWFNVHIIHPLLRSQL